MCTVIVITPKKPEMSLCDLNNPAMQVHSSYVNLFQVAQKNFTLWLLEENVSRIKNRQKFLTKPPSYHTPPPYPRDASSRQ